MRGVHGIAGVTGGTLPAQIWHTYMTRRAAGSAGRAVRERRAPRRSSRGAASTSSPARSATRASRTAPVSTSRQHKNKTTKNQKKTTTAKRRRPCTPRRARRRGRCPRRRRRRSPRSPPPTTTSPPPTTTTTTTTTNTTRPAGRLRDPRALVRQGSPASRAPHREARPDFSPRGYAAFLWPSIFSHQSSSSTSDATTFGPLGQRGRRHAALLRELLEHGGAQRVQSLVLRFDLAGQLGALGLPTGHVTLELEQAAAPWVRPSSMIVLDIAALLLHSV